MPATAAAPIATVVATTIVASAPGGASISRRPWSSAATPAGPWK